MKLGSEEFGQVIRQSAALRGGQQFDEAIALIESKLPEMEDDCLMNAYLECFYAAVEPGNNAKATEYAEKLAAIEPELLPSVRRFLSRN